MGTVKDYLNKNLEALHPLIRENLKFHNEVTPENSYYYIDYQGEYTCVYSKYENKQFKNLIEQIEDVHFLPNGPEDNSKLQRCYIVTRQIGTDDPKEWDPDTRISLVIVNNNEFRVWIPRLKELFIAFKKLYISIDEGNKNHLGNLKVISDSIATTIDCSIRELIDNHSKESPTFIEILEVAIPTASFYSILKEIFISEDMRYPYFKCLGRYLTITALIDFALNNLSFEEIDAKYNISKRQQ